MKKVNYTWANLQGGCLELARQINASGFKPDYIVGLTRGGLIPATMLSHYLGIKMFSLDISLRDHINTESNGWMSEDAIARHANILIVDDINDSGATFTWIKTDWQDGCLRNDPLWNDVWHNNVRFASLFSNASSSFEVDYAAEYINKIEEDVWVDFPWETFWKGHGNG